MKDEKYSCFHEQEHFHAEEDEYAPRRPNRIFLALIAFVILIAFMLWSFPQIGIFFSDLSFLAQNQQLREEEIVMNSLPAIVSVEVKGAEGKNKNGTGFNIAAEGLILTNYHVIEGGSSIKIIFPDGQSYFSNEYRRISQADIAVIKLKQSELPYLPLELQEIAADEILLTIIGNPLGYKQIPVQGKIGSYYKYNDYTILEINAPVKPGSSGSPVINSNGRIVGIVFAHRDLQQDGSAEYHALAIPLHQFGEEIKSMSGK